MLYLYLKWLHVLSAILAVGANTTYGIWLARASQNPDNLPFTLKSIKMLDDRVANPAYGLLLLTGLGMAFAAPLPLTTPWLLTGLSFTGCWYCSVCSDTLLPCEDRSASWRLKASARPITRLRRAAGPCSGSSWPSSPSPSSF
jgi:uncharacterized membrane protein